MIELNKSIKFALECDPRPVYLDGKYGVSIYHGKLDKMRVAVTKIPLHIFNESHEDIPERHFHPNVACRYTTFVHHNYGYIVGEPFQYIIQDFIKGSMYNEHITSRICSKISQQPEFYKETLLGLCYLQSNNLSSSF